MGGFDDLKLFVEAIREQAGMDDFAAMGEMVCAESAGVDYFNLNLHPVPQADKPDF